MRPLQVVTFSLTGAEMIKTNFLITPPGVPVGATFSELGVMAALIAAVQIVPVFSLSTQLGIPYWSGFLSLSGSPLPVFRSGIFSNGVDGAALVEGANTFQIGLTSPLANTVRDFDLDGQYNFVAQVILGGP